MNGKRESELAHDGGMGQSNRSDEITKTDYIIADSLNRVNPHDPLPFDAIPPYPLTISGGKIAWCIQDTISTLLTELQARGLDLPDSEIDQAIANTWVYMASSDYVAGRLRTWGDQQWRQNWERHLKALREQGDEEVPLGY